MSIQIEVKGVKYSALASAETMHFLCTVYIDGKKAFTARNDGHGGCTYFHPIGRWPYDEREINARIAEQYPPLDLHDGSSVPRTLEMVVDDLVADYLERRNYQRLLGRRIIGFDGNGVLVQWPTKLQPTVPNCHWIQDQNPDVEILNGQRDAVDRLMTYFLPHRLSVRGNES